MLFAPLKAMSATNNWEVIDEKINNKICSTPEMQRLVGEHSNIWDRMVSERTHSAYGREVRNLKMFTPLSIYANSLHGKGRLERKIR